jgi:hypothetical protein
MNKPSDSFFSTRPTLTLELPLDKRTRILHPEQIILKIGDSYHDIGSLCYTLRSVKPRKSRQPREVITDSINIHRRKQIPSLIKAFSSLVTDGGKTLSTLRGYSFNLINFTDWADENDLNDCFAGGEYTIRAFRAWASDVQERYKRQEICENQHNSCLTQVCELLEAATGVQNLMRGIRKVKRKPNPNGGTEPLALYDFAHAVAINQSLFDGLCDLVLEQRPFPYKLELPASLEWEENHLWLFPTTLWRLPPHQRGDASRARMGSAASWCYDYENGRLSTPEEISCKYNDKSPAERFKTAKGSIKRAHERIEKANADANHLWRLTLGMHAQRAFLFLFFCNTGGNDKVVRELETDGKTIDVNIRNQKFRGLKWRAGGKAVELIAPVSFMPRLRRYMELRNYLLQGRKTPYLFFTTGNRNSMPPQPLGCWDLENHYIHLLLEIDPRLPKMGARVLRASVDDYYLRLHDSVVAAAVMGHTVETEQQKYGRGSANDHHVQIELFMESVSHAAHRQVIITKKDVKPDNRSLEEGGLCEAFGQPEALAVHAPIQPDCKDSQGCLFCTHRVLVADEEDVRKIASAAYVMEQLISGPQHEAVLRPLISKCDEDLEKIAAFHNCNAMVKQIRKDVNENENLTPFWADKYHLFLELGVIS